MSKATILRIVLRIVEIAAITIFIVVATTSIYALGCGQMLVASKGILVSIVCAIVAVVTRHYAEDIERRLRSQHGDFVYHPVKDLERLYRYDYTEFDRESSRYEKGKKE